MFAEVLKILTSKFTRILTSIATRHSSLREVHTLSGGVLLWVLNLYHIPFNEPQLHFMLTRPEILLFIEAKSTHPFVSLKVVSVRLEPSLVPTNSLPQPGLGPV